MIEGDSQFILKKIRVASTPDLYLGTAKNIRSVHSSMLAGKLLAGTNCPGSSSSVPFSRISSVFQENTSNRRVLTADAACCSSAEEGRP